MIRPIFWGTVPCIGYSRIQRARGLAHPKTRRLDGWCRQVLFHFGKASAFSAGPIVGGSGFQKQPGHECGNEGDEKAGGCGWEADEPFHWAKLRQASKAVLEQVWIELPEVASALKMLPDESFQPTRVVVVFSDERLSQTQSLGKWQGLEIIVN